MPQKKTKPQKAPYRPVAQGRASIAAWSIEVRFRTRKQAAKLIRKMLSDEIAWSFSYEETEIVDGDGVSRRVFIVTVKTMSWGVNLERFARWVRKADYRDA